MAGSCRHVMHVVKHDLISIITAVGILETKQLRISVVIIWRTMENEFLVTCSKIIYIIRTPKNHL